MGQHGAAISVTTDLAKKQALVPLEEMEGVKVKGS